jgi:hypothetical protein
MPPKNVTDYIGEANIPNDVRRRRRQVQQLMTRMGTPVVIKHRYNDEDVEEGIAERSPNFDDIYNQSSNTDHLSHGVGWVSVEKSANEWINPNDGSIVVSNTSPGAGYTRAPKYRGYGPGYLTYLILPDVSEDEFRIDASGAIIRAQVARAQMGWYPAVNDTDILILVQLDRAQRIINSFERYQLKETSPISVRGQNRGGGRRPNEAVDFGNQHVLNQTFELTLIPPNDEIYRVEIDR